MLRPRPTRSHTFCLALTLCVAATAQSTLPPTAPTALQATNQVGPLTATPTQPNTTTRAHRADVLYSAGLLSINANNSSLNQILREIARQTGMKITGGVRDDRVFGHYGPATPDVILETLIDGNTTNIVISHNAANQPQELTLTPRAGGASPPNPNAPGFDDSNDDERPAPPPQPSTPAPTAVYTAPIQANPGSVPPSIPQPVNNVLGSPSNVSPTVTTMPTTNSVSTDSLPTPSTTTQTSTGIVDAPNPPAGTTPPATADGTTPNGPKTTAEQYAEQLMKLRQQQQSAKPQ